MFFKHTHTHTHTHTEHTKSYFCSGLNRNFMIALTWTTYLKAANNLDNKKCHVGKWH